MTCLALPCLALLLFAAASAGWRLCAQVYTHGRRAYRELIYTTDARFALCDLQPPTSDMDRPWKVWERHASDYTQLNESSVGSKSLVVTREKNVPHNFSGTIERFIPRELLDGLVPEALLEDYAFWQDQKVRRRGPRSDFFPFSSASLRFIFSSYFSFPV